MFEKRWLRAVDELGKVIEVVYLSRYASEKFNWKFEQPHTYQIVWWIISVGREYKTYL